MPVDAARQGYGEMMPLAGISTGTWSMDSADADRRVFAPTQPLPISVILMK